MFDFTKQVKAIILTRKRILNGEIVRPNICTKCSNKKNIFAHHPNYDKPEDIVWLCPKCHRKAHKEDAKQDRKRRKELLKVRLGNVSHLVNIGR